MRIACWIPEATNTFLEYVTVIDFSLQQRLCERSSMLRYIYEYNQLQNRSNHFDTPCTYIACLVHVQLQYRRMRVPVCM